MAEVTGWNELQKLIFAKKVLTGLAKLFVQAEKGIKTWSELKKRLTDEFQLKVSSAQVHKMLMSRRKRPTEPVQEYVLVMRELGSRANIDAETIIQYIIDGIPDDQVNKIVLYGAKNFGDFKEKVKLYNQIKTKSTFVSNDSSRMKVKSDKNKEVCFNCGQKGHKSNLCPDKAKGAKCFKCGNFGHISTKCVKNKPEVSKSVNTVSVKPKRSVKVLIDNVKLTALFDSGSDISAIRSDVFYDNFNNITLTKKIINISGIGCSSVESLGMFSGKVTVNDVDVDLDFHIIPSSAMKYEALVGEDLLSQVSVSLSDNEVVIYKKEEDRLLMQIDLVSSKDDAVDVTNIENKDCQEKVKKMIECYFPEKTKSVDIKMKIVLKDEEPIYSSPRRLSIEEKQIVEKQMQEWLNEEIIRESCSDFSSPIVLVKKKNGETRICCDFRRINKKIVKDRFPLPLIEDVLDRLQGAKYFTTIDLRNGFFHVSVSEESSKYTSFVTHNGQYEFLKCPFGLCNSPAVFQRYISHIFRDLSNKNIAMYYMDDIVIFRSTEREGVKNLEIDLDVARNYGLDIKKEKCQFLKKRITFLGYIIEDGKVKPSEEKAAAIRNFPEPTTLKQIQSFLGLTGYFRKFIPGYSIVAKPLSNLLRKEQIFMFGIEQKSAINVLKDMLCNEPVIHLYHQDRETQVHTDASKHGYGAEESRR